jgi:hypothetical protein
MNTLLVLMDQDLEIAGHLFPFSSAGGRGVEILDKASK